MSPEVKSYYDSERGIYFKHYSGEVYIEDVFKTWEEKIRNDISGRGIKKFVVDYKKASIKFPSGRATDIADFYKKHDDVFRDSKIAMVMESPDQVVFPHLVEMQNVSFIIRTFYTMEAALQWLMI